MLNYLIFTLCLFLISGTAHADLDGERAALARLVHELQALEPLIQEAQTQANPDTRIRFQYDWLRQDLARVRLGIEEHINAPPGEPRKVSPLRGVWLANSKFIRRFGHLRKFDLAWHLSYANAP